jgi:tRNA (guanine37-N1)-methyltransferase
MRIDILTVLPDMIAASLDYSIVKRARDRGIVDIRVVNLRDYTTDRHHTTDDVPYGGGGGMVMKIDPIYRALKALDALPEQIETDARPDAYIDREEQEAPPAPAESPFATEGVGKGLRPRVVLTDPRGERFTQEMARAWAREERIVILCGHYEGVDDRVRQHLITDEVSIGDYVLTGGELPALVIADALARLQPGALGDSQAPENDSFAGDLLEYPHYTRPRSFQGWDVPNVLLSGNFAFIERWRRWHQLRDTHRRRPDLFEKLTLTGEEIAWMDGAEPEAPDQDQIAARGVSPRPPSPQRMGEQQVNTWTDRDAHGPCLSPNSGRAEETAAPIIDEEENDGTRTQDDTGA